MPKYTYYELLGVAPDATREELRRGYLRRARRWHPDQFSGAPAAERRKAEKAMARINQAWDVLSDPGRRERYDLSLKEPPPSARPAGAGAPARRPARPDVVEPDDVQLDTDDTPLGPLPLVLRFLVWAPVSIVVLLFIIVVFTAFARSDLTTVVEREPDVGACVRLGGSELQDAPCELPDTFEIVAVAVDGAPCPADTVVARYDEDLVCLVPAS